MRRSSWRSRSWALVLFGPAALTLACTGSGNTPTSPPCGVPCQDGVALNALRDELKLVYNLTLQGKPVGDQDAMTSCPLGGSAHVAGTATSNADQGTTTVDLSYAFTGCAYSQTDTDPTQTFSVTISGTMTEMGTLSEQPSSTTALLFKGEGVSVKGSIYDPPIAVDDKDCGVDLGQNGNDLAGTFCGRDAGTSL